MNASMQRVVRESCIVASPDLGLRVRTREPTGNAVVRLTSRSPGARVAVALQLRQLNPLVAARECRVQPLDGRRRNALLSDRATPQRRLSQEVEVVCGHSLAAGSTHERTP